jgi:hypothetical protein
MPTHNPNEPEREHIDASKGFEHSDVRIAGIAVFLTALTVFVVVVGLLSYGIGKVINARMAKEDATKSKWVKTVDVRPLGNMPSNPELQNKVAELTQQFPTPKLQTDDGLQDTADLHAREDLLLEYYSWADQGQGSPRRVRIPIERAMELIAQRGLPVAPQLVQAPLLTGEQRPTVAVPLTNGFARTAYEQEEARTLTGTGKHTEQRK